MIGPLVREYDKKFYKKCIKCRSWKPRADIEDDDGVIKKRQFGKHESSSDGLQSICYSCKNISNTAARERNPTQRIRHHTGTRCLTQLGKDMAPPNFVANLEDYLGYKITSLVKALSNDLKEREGPKRKLRDALNEGYHIDHKQPLSSFAVIYMDQHQIKCVDWDIFRECWAISNLQAIPADVNLAKGAQTNVTKESRQAQAQGTEEASKGDAEENQEGESEVAASSSSGSP